MLHKVSQDPFLKNLPVDITTLGHGTFPLTSDAILGNVGNLLCCVADSLIHNPTADVLPVPGDDGADAGVSPGVSAEVVDGSVIAHRGQDLLMLRANTQRSFILVICCLRENFLLLLYRLIISTIIFFLTPIIILPTSLPCPSLILYSPASREILMELYMLPNSCRLVFVIL